MKKAYLIRMSQDGNLPYIFTNILAMYNYIISENLYDVNIMECYDYSNKETKKYTLNYANLNKCIKKYGAVAVTLKNNNNNYDCSLSIELLQIISK